MTGRLLQEAQEGLQTIEFIGDEAASVYNRICRLMKNTDLPDVIYLGEHKEPEIASTVTYHIGDSTVYFSSWFDSDNPVKVNELEISIASPNPEYRQKSLLRLEQILGIKLNIGEVPAVIAG